MKNVLLALLVSSLTSCHTATSISTSSSSSPSSIIAYPNVPKDLWMYYQRFEKESLIRQQKLDLKALGISAEIAKIPRSTGSVGLCNQSGDLHHIIVDKTFWETASDLKKELIVFHELGHCVLNRRHNDEAEGGICRSIMRTGETACLANYTEQTRAVYLDELFRLPSIAK